MTLALQCQRSWCHTELNLDSDGLRAGKTATLIIIATGKIVVDISSLLSHLSTTNNLLNYKIHVVNTDVQTACLTTTVAIC